MRYRRAITTGLITIGLAFCVTGASAARRPAEDPQFGPRVDWGVLAQARPGTLLRLRALERLFSRVDVTRSALVSFGNRLVESGGFDPVPDQQGGGSGALGQRTDRGEFDSGGIAHDPIYIGEGPVGPAPM